jgi:hypothetical protein
VYVIVTLNPAAGNTYTFTVLGTNWRGTVITDTITINPAPAALFGATTLYFASVTSVIYTRSGGANHAGATTVGYNPILQWVVPLQTVYFDVEVDTSQVSVYFDLTAVTPTRLTAAYNWRSATLVTDWVYKPGGAVYFAPVNAPAATDTIRIQAWRY